LIHFFKRLLSRILNLCVPMALNRNSPGGDFPMDLKGFGYAFNQAGQMRQLEEDGVTISDRPFKFEVKPGDRTYNQAHYEALGEVITEEVYSLLESRGQLERRELKVEGVKEKEPKSFVFVSSEFQEKENLLVIIHGSGVVRAGQWARRLIMNEDLDKGTVLPYVEEARNHNWGVLVMNTNLNEIDGKEIPGSDSPESHAVTVWEQMIKKSKAEKVVVLAHSYGGLVTVELANVFKKDFLGRVEGVLLTDSVHGRLTRDKELDRKLSRVGRNWVSSEKPLGTLVDRVRGGDRIECVSAGHEQHEWTSWAASRDIFRVMRLIEEGRDWKEQTQENPSKHLNGGAKAKREDL